MYLYVCIALINVRIQPVCIYRIYIYIYIYTCIYIYVYIYIVRERLVQGLMGFPRALYLRVVERGL